MPPGRLLSYTLMLVYYPMTAVNWLLGDRQLRALPAGSARPGPRSPPPVWLMLYSDAAALQIGLYLWNRRHNVSPHEPEGSGGLAGMGMSALSAPIYLKSLGSAVLRTRGRFVVTPKGGRASPDRLWTFRIHLFWAAVLAVSLIASVHYRHTHAAMRTWAVLALCIALRARRDLGLDARCASAARPAARPSRHAATAARRRGRTRRRHDDRRELSHGPPALAADEEDPVRRRGRRCPRRSQRARRALLRHRAVPRVRDQPSPSTWREYGAWHDVDIPKEYRTNAIHAALLHTGKVLIIAGSGNKQNHFDAGTFDTVLWNPKNNTFKKIHTPEDFFCGGHAQLPDGKLLVAGGTARYEVLDGEVKRAGGGMRVKNEDPDRTVTLKKGTMFRSPRASSTCPSSTSRCRRAKREFEVSYYATGR